MTKQVRETAAGRSISATVIMKGKRHVATVQAHYSNAGVVSVDVWHTDGTALQQARAGGYGYDKLTAALSGMMIDGHKLTNHCGARVDPPRGLRYFPADYKPPRGYSLANYGTFDRATGERRGSYHWRDMAIAELGESAEWETIAARAKELEAAADLVPGYSDCYRAAGLDYLRALGYTLIEAI